MRFVLTPIAQKAKHWATGLNLAEETMSSQMKERIRKAIDGMLDENIKQRIARLNVQLNEYGVDPFGFDIEFTKLMLPMAMWLYTKWFRVETIGIKNVPQGKIMVVANHSGQIPIDGMMLLSAMFLEAEPPRVLRSMAERWAATLPVFSWLFPRSGQIVGTRENCKLLLDRGESILVFPEGSRGISKPFAKRYQLTEFGLGFMRLVLMTDTPIVPVAIVGAEEQTVNLFNLKPLADLIGFPAIPITPTMPLLGPLALFPLPTKYHIYFGKAMRFSGDPNEDDAEIEDKVRQVKTTIQRMLSDGLKARKHIFW